MKKLCAFLLGLLVATQALGWEYYNVPDDRSLKGIPSRMEHLFVQARVPLKDAARLYVFRPKKTGRLTDHEMNVFINVPDSPSPAIRLTSLFQNNYSSLTLEPGEYEIIVSPSDDYVESSVPTIQRLTLTVKAGKNYFVRIHNNSLSKSSAAIVQTRYVRPLLESFG